jgi:hypothetical protein
MPAPSSGEVPTNLGKHDRYLLVRQALDKLAKLVTLAAHDQHSTEPALVADEGTTVAPNPQRTGPDAVEESGCPSRCPLVLYRGAAAR